MRLNFTGILHKLLVVALVGFALTWASEKSANAMPIGALQDSRVQEQLFVAGLFNLSVGLATLVSGGHLDAVISQPDAWCQVESQVGDQRVRGMILSSASFLSVIVVGELRYNLRGDLGMTLISGFVGYMGGLGFACSVGEHIAPESTQVRSILNLSVPNIISSITSVLGYHIRYAQTGSVES